MLQMETLKPQKRAYGMNASNEMTLNKRLGLLGPFMYFWEITAMQFISEQEGIHLPGKDVRWLGYQLEHH